MFLRKVKYVHFVKQNLKILITFSEFEKMMITIKQFNFIYIIFKYYHIYSI